MHRQNEGKGKTPQSLHTHTHTHAHTHTLTHTFTSGRLRRDFAAYAALIRMSTCEGVCAYAQARVKAVAPLQ